MPTLGLSANETITDHWWVVALWYAIWSLAAALAFVMDKRRAVRGAARIREKHMHLLELAGGWPGTLVAGHLIRHKTIDGRYRLVRTLIVVIHIGVWAGAAMLLAGGL